MKKKIIIGCRSGKGFIAIVETEQAANIIKDISDGSVGFVKIEPSDRKDMKILVDCASIESLLVEDVPEVLSPSKTLHLPN